MRPPAGAGFVFRPFRHADLPAAFELQQESYAESLCDSLEAFASRLELGPDTCWIAEREGRLHGYILAHPWPSASPPAVDTVLTAPPAGGTGVTSSRLPGPSGQGVAEGLVHYVHDLSVSSAAKGAGLGRGLVEHSQHAAAQLGLRHSELVAVPGAAAYWARFGYREVPLAHALADKLRSYGPEAVYMRRALPFPSS